MGAGKVQSVDMYILRSAIVEGRYTSMYVYVLYKRRDIELNLNQMLLCVNYVAVYTYIGAWGSVVVKALGY
jgi:hypothetical protein